MPVVLGWTFGTLGTIRAEKEELQQRTLALLDAEVRHRTKSLHEMYLQTVLSLSAAIEAKNAYTHGHCRRVWAYARAAATEMGLGARELETLEYTCYLHDVGKIGLPDAVLDKPGRLTEDEYTQVKEHSARGGDIVQRISGFSTVAKLVRWHHERVDGSGYPDGLVGEQIPLLARIVAVADTMDAMVSARPYRAGMPLEAALAELRRCAGLPFVEEDLPGRDRQARQHYDPEVVQALITALDAGLEIETGALPLMMPLGQAPVVSHPLNCWEIQGCGAEQLAASDARACPVVHAAGLDGVNRRVNGGRACWSVAGALCRKGHRQAPPGGAEVCADCAVLATVRDEEGVVWFKLAPSVGSEPSTWTSGR